MNKKFNNLLVIDGGEVKTNEEGLVKGLGIVFGSENEPDQSAQRDFFTDDSKIRNKDTFDVPLYYNHGFGPISEEIGEATLTKTAKGWEASAKLDLESEAGQKVYQLVKKSPHGFSTGALQHLVKREPKSNNTNWLQQWVVGEISLTERPAERKAVVEYIKSVDGEIVTEDWAPEETSPIVKAYNDNEVVWEVETSEVPFSGFIQAVDYIPSQLDVKYTSGTVSYNVYTYDEESGKGAEMNIMEFGDADELLEHITNVINKAKFNKKSTEVEDLDEKIKSIVEEAVKNIGGCGCGGAKNSEESGDELEVADGTKGSEEYETELTDVRNQLALREDALTKAKEEIARLEILAGAKKTLDNITINKGK